MKKIKHNIEKGFSLLEVLITMVILAIGLLAIASLQFKGMQYSDDALIRSDLNILAYDIFERMRVNSDNIDDYVANFTVPLSCNGDASCDPSGCAAAAASASNDLVCWRSQVAEKFPPGGTANITSAGNEYYLQFSWTRRDGQNVTMDYNLIN